MLNFEDRLTAVSLPPPLPRVGSRRIWISETHKWEYAPVELTKEYIQQICSRFQLSKEPIMTWNDHFETWLPLKRDLKSQMIEDLSEHLTNFSRQIEKRNHDRSNLARDRPDKPF